MACPAFFSQARSGSGTLLVGNPMEGSPPISGVGFPVETSSFCPSKYSVLSFAESFLTLSLTLAGQLTPLQSPAEFATLLRAAAHRN